MSTVPPRSWLPDFCRLPRLGAALLAAEAAVVVIAIAPGAASRWTLSEFGQASALALWIALVSAVLLCKLRVWIRRLPLRLGVFIAWVLPVAVAALGVALLYPIDESVGSGFGLPPGRMWPTVLSCAALAGLIGAVTLRYFYVQEQWRAQVQANAEAEVRALQARIRPHFLFNSMNTIASLIRIEPARAERAVEDLADLFRAALGAGKGEASLEEELHLAGRYLAIEKLRLGDRLQVRWDLVEPLPRGLPLPRLTLQPLVENAVLHGVSRLEDGGEIAIAARMDGRLLRLTIRNPSPPPNGARGSGHAQESIAARLAYHYGREARMTAGWDGGYYRCELEIPAA